MIVNSLLLLQKMFKKTIKYRSLFTLMLLSGFIAVVAQDVSFIAKAPGSVVVGNPFYLQYEVNAEGENLRAPEFKGFDQKAGPTLSRSSSYQFVNGRSSREEKYTYTYVLLAEKEGTFTISPASIEVKGKKYSSNSLTIKVIPGNQTGAEKQESTTSGISEQNIFLRATVNKTSPYENEALLYSVKLYTRLTVSSLPNADFPEFNGFLASDIESQNSLKEEIENYNGLVYRVYTVHQKLLYPQKSGKITIEPAVVNANIRIRSQRRSYNIFDDIFDSYQDVSKQLRSNSVSINVKPLSSPKPAGFKNLVGDFNLSSSITATEVKANEPITVKFVISGEGNHKLLPTPQIDFPGDFEKYDPKINNDLRTTLGGVVGSRTFEYLVIPRYAGEFEVPAVKIPYFDPKTGSYKMLTSKAFNITVERSENGESNPAVVSNFSAKEDVRFLGSDIRYIKTDSLKLHKSGIFFIGSSAFWILLIAPVLLYFFALVLYRKKLKDRANMAKMKNKRANKLARKRLKLSASLLKQNNKEQFYEEVLRALWGYISDKLNIPVSKLNKDNIEDLLSGKGVDSESVKSFIDLLNSCEFARYAPSAVDGGMEETYANAIKVISTMDNKIKG